MDGPHLFISWSHTEGLLVLFHPGLEGTTEIDTDPKGRILSFKFTHSNHRILCVYTSSGYNTREQLARGRFFEGLQSYRENKNEGNENKIILGDFNCTIDKMNRDGGNKTQRLYSWSSSYALSKLIVDNGLKNLWRRENQDFPGSTATICPLNIQGLY